MSNIIDLLKNNKRFQYIAILSVIALFCIVLNITFSAFTRTTNKNAANIKVENLSYSTAIDGNTTSIIEATNNKITKKNIFLIANNTLDTKYELTYEVCTDSTCSETTSKPENFKVEYSSKTIDSVKDTIGKTSTKIIRLIITNDTDTTYYIKLGVNAGFTHNTLVYKNQIVDEYSENDLKVISYIDGVKNNSFPNTEDYTPFINCNNGASAIALWDGEKWLLTVDNFTQTETVCEVDFSTGSPKEYWKSSSGSLLAGIRNNNNIQRNSLTTPGVDISGSGNDTITVNTLCNGTNDCEIDYSSDFDEVWTGNGSKGNYSSIYSSLAGKWVRYFEQYYYVVSADSDSLVVRNSAEESTKESVLVRTPDDYGTTYYYRGDVENNYVVFANMCWRIVRIDGIGNTKLALYNYNPTNAANPCDHSLDGNHMAYARLSTSDSESFISKFNNDSNKNTHVGYMYSNNPDSTDYNTAHANDNDSTILTNLKNWYDRVFTSDQKDVLADTIWCNDKRVLDDLSYDPMNLGNIVGDGLSNHQTFYQPSERLGSSMRLGSNSVSDQRLYNTSDAAPSLKCGNDKNSNKLSKFTASDTEYGNGALNGYKIGLLTTDEVAFAGGNAGFPNYSYYLHKNTYNNYWVNSPSGFYFNSIAFNWYVYPSGNLSGDGMISTSKSLRPVIALKPSTNIVSGGNGTASNPFVVTLN